MSRLSYLFAHLHLLSSDSFSSDLLSSDLFSSDSSHLCFSTVHSVGSFTSKLPSIIYIYIYIIYIYIYNVTAYKIYTLYIYIYTHNGIIQWSVVIWTDFGSALPVMVSKMKYWTCYQLFSISWHIFFFVHTWGYISMFIHVWTHVNPVCLMIKAHFSCLTPKC